jgi:hypothetical protein
MTWAAASRPPAPGLFSITTVCPISSENFCPTRRAKRSLPPPAPNGMIMRIGRFGKLASGSLCANADPKHVAAKRANPPSIARPIVIILISTSSLGRLADIASPGAFMQAQA